MVHRSCNLQSPSLELLRQVVNSWSGGRANRLLRRLARLPLAHIGALISLLSVSAF